MILSIRNAVAVLFLISGAGTMIMLGVWQLQRLDWKNNIIAHLNAEYAKPQDQLYLSFDDIQRLNQDILYASLQGQYLYDQQILLGPKPHNGAIGYHVITPLQTSQSIIFVNRGWIEQNKISALDSEKNSDMVTLTGIIRKPEWNKFTPDNNANANIWTKLSPLEMAQAMDIQKTVSDRVLYLTKGNSANSPVLTIHEKWYPRNKHQQYALFWFTMAAVFIGLFAIYAVRQK